MDGISLEGRVGETAFLLEVPPAAMAAVARHLGCAQPEVEGILRDLLGAEALQLAGTSDWRTEGFRWDALEKTWRKTYGFSRLAPRLATG